MLRGYSVMEIDDVCLKKTNFKYCKINSYVIHKRNIYEKEELKNLKLKFKDNIFVVVEDEKLFIKNIEIPKCRKNKIIDFVKQELNFIYDGIGEYVLNYEVIEKQNHSVKLLAYYSDCEKIKIINEIFKYSNVKNVYFIQLICFSFMSKKIQETSYAFLFLFNNTLYLLSCKNNNIVGNNLIKNINSIKINLEEEIERFIYSSFEGQNVNVYTVNMKKINIKDTVYELESFNEEDLLEISENYA